MFQNWKKKSQILALRLPSSTMWKLFIENRRYTSSLAKGCYQLLIVQRRSLLCHTSSQLNWYPGQTLVAAEARGGRWQFWGDVATSLFSLCSSWAKLLALWWRIAWKKKLWWRRILRKKLTRSRIASSVNCWLVHSSLLLSASFTLVSCKWYLHIAGLSKITPLRFQFEWRTWL